MKRKRIVLILTIICLMCLSALVLTSCKKTEFTLNFIVDGKEYSAIVTSGSETIKMPVNPTKDGYIFDGWYWDNDVWKKPFTANSLLNEPLTSNMSVYAKFVSDKQSEYNDVYQDIVKAIKTYAQTKNTLSDGISYIFTGNAGNASDFSFQFALLYNEPYNSDGYICVELIIKKDGDYHATLMYTFEQNQNDYVKGVYTDYATKSKGYFTLTPNNYYNNTNIYFNRFVWGSGYSELENSETPYRLVYESGASVYTETGISLFDKFLKEEFSYGMEKLGFVNMHRAQTADPISTIYCKSSLTIKQGQTAEVPYVTFPFYNRGNETLISDDNSVVTVSGSNVTAVNAGSTAVTIRAGSVSKSVSVTVNPITNADNVRAFLNESNDVLFDVNGNKLDGIPSQDGPYYLLLIFPSDNGQDKFSIICTYKYASPKRLAPSVYTMYFELPNDNNVIDQIYNTATGTYTFFKDGSNLDATSMNDFELLYNGKLNFKYRETSFMKTLSSYDGITCLNNMQDVATETIEVLGRILSKNSNGYLDANKTSYFDLSLNDTTADTASFDCDFSQYFGEKIKSAKLYQNGSLIDDCTDEFSADYTLSNLSSNTGYSLEVVFAYDKNDGNGEQTVVRTVNFTTKIANGTPCTVTYNANGGEVEANTQTLHYNNYYNLFIPTRTGHNFDGWYCNDELVENSGTWTLGLNVTLVAKWSVATYSIRYGNVSGATNNNPATYTFGISVSVNNPTKTGYTFLGWTTSSSAEPVKNYAITSSDTGDLQLTACWQANEYTVTFECNGADEELPPIQIEYDAWFALPDISRVGYTFNGWYNASTRMSDGYFKTAQNITLSARWTANKNTPYLVEVYQQNISDDEYTLFKTTNLTGTSDSVVSPSVETYVGFTTPARQTVNITADGSLVVKYYYLRNSYTVNYVTNGGVAMEFTSHKYEAALNLADAVREDFTFGGWYTDVRLTNVVADTIMPAQNITVYAWWTEETKTGDFSYSGTNSITVSKYNGTSTSVRIPSFIGNVAVTAIGSSAFQNNTNVTSVTLNDGIVSIGSYAFSGCSALTQFNSSNANELVVPNKVETIGEYAFQNIALVTKVVVADSVTSIGSAVFNGCSALEDITIPFVGANATASGVFGYLFRMERNYSSSQLNYKMSSGKTFQGNSYYDKYNTVYIIYYIPTSIRKVTITMQTVIPPKAFYNCDLIEKLTISQNTTKISEYAFYECNALKQFNSDVDGEFNIPTRITAIDNYSFYANKLATKATLGQDLTRIGDYAFSGCTGLTQFNSKNVNEFVVPGNIETIGQYAFSGCSALTQFISENTNEIMVPNGVLTIGQYAFQNVSLVTKVVVADSVTSIGFGAFKGCDVLEEIALPFVGGAIDSTSPFGSIFGLSVKDTGQNLKTSGGYGTDQGYSYYVQYQGTFYKSYLIPIALKNVTITVQTKIPQKAFQNCDLLEKITIPENTISIGSHAFYNCHALKQLNSNVEGEFNIPTGVTAISDYAFYGNQQASKVTLGQDVTSIGNYAFSGCSALTQFNSSNANELVVPNKVETIGEYAFQNVSLVTKIVVADSVTSIGVGTFKGCNALVDITLPFIGNSNVSNDLTKTFGYIFGYSVGSSANKNAKTSQGNTYQNIWRSGNQYNDPAYYYYCIPATLKDVSITVQTVIPENAFYNCDLLEKITIPENATSIGSYAFYNCHALKQLNSNVDGEFNIPTGVTAISDYAFYGNQQASKVTLGQEVTSVGNSTFSGCSALNNINVTADMTIASTSFSGCLMTTKTGVCYVGEVLYIYNGTMPSGYVLNVKPGTASIYANALKGQTGLTKVILPESVTIIGNSAFEGCTALAEITQTKAIKTLGERSFYNCKLLTGIDISDVTAVPQYAFYACVALQEISLPNVVTIADRAFSGCSALSKFNSDVEGQLILPECCTSVGQYAFADCTALADVNLANATYASSALAHCPSLAKLTVANVDTYLGVIFGTTSVSGSYAARQNTTTYYIPSTLTEVVITAQSSNKIANYAFANCKSLVKVTLPNNVTTLGEYAFNGCVALQQVVLPTELNTIGQYCFNGCTALTDADLSVCSLQTINAYAFQNCSALNSIYINSSVTFIGEYVFNGCTDLTISCQVAEYPSDWDYNWNPSNCTVNWGVAVGL